MIRGPEQEDFQQYLDMWYILQMYIVKYVTYRYTSYDVE